MLFALLLCTLLSDSPEQSVYISICVFLCAGALLMLFALLLCTLLSDNPEQSVYISILCIYVQGRF